MTHFRFDDEQRRMIVRVREHLSSVASLPGDSSRTRWIQETIDRINGRIIDQWIPNPDFMNRPGKEIPPVGRWQKVWRDTGAIYDTGRMDPAREPDVSAGE